MRSLRLFLQLTLYYGIAAAVLALGLWLYPPLLGFLPIGGVEALLNTPAPNPLGGINVEATHVRNLGDSLVWLVTAIAGALFAVLPVSWTYMEIRNRHEYDQSLVETIIILPITVTSIVIVVHNSLALAFSLAGIVTAVQFRNSLKSSGDALFILLAIGIGLSAGIGAVELAAVMSFAFNYCFLTLWAMDYGARKGTHRYLRKSHPSPHAEEEPAPQEALPPAEPTSTSSPAPPATGTS